MFVLSYKAAKKYECLLISQSKDWLPKVEWSHQDNQFDNPHILGARKVFWFWLCREIVLCENWKPENLFPVCCIFIIRLRLKLRGGNECHKSISRFSTCVLERKVQNVKRVRSLGLEHCSVKLLIMIKPI